MDQPGNSNSPPEVATGPKKSRPRHSASEDAVEVELPEEHEEQDGLEEQEQQEPAVQTVVNVLEEAVKGNFIPAMMVLSDNRPLDLSAVNEHGYTLVHYATGLANFQALECFFRYDSKCLAYKSSAMQDLVMNACSFSNVLVLKFVLERSPEHDFAAQDDWGFTALTYAIKNNFLAGLCHLVCRGASFEQDIRDLNKCSYLHWACFMDRLFIIGILFRCDFDFQVVDSLGNTPWDRAVQNFSLFAINFMLDHSQRPLKTLYFLKGKTSFPEVDMLPVSAKTKAYEIKSNYIARKMLYQSRVRQGVYSSFRSLFEHSYGYFIGEFVSYNWYKHNLARKYWLKTYLAIFLVCFALWWQTAASIGARVSVLYRTSCYFISLVTLILMVNFGASNTILIHFRNYKKKKLLQAIESPRGGLLPTKKDEYYVNQKDYEDYLNMYDMNDCMFKDINRMVENGAFDALKEMHETQYCSICGIKKKRKTRHCPNVNLCVPKYHFYSYFFDKPVYFANELSYFLFIIFELMLLGLFVGVYFLKFEQVFEKGYLLAWFHMLYLNFEQSGWLTFALLTAVSWTICVKLLQVSFFGYCVAKNITVDELYNPQYYPYLFIPMANLENKYLFKNVADKGFCANLRLFFRQAALSTHARE